MRFEAGQLETLAAIADAGTFDAAARLLHVTPSAVSQRVRALERAAGRVLVRRTTPATITPAGEPLLRLGRQLQLLTAETAVALGEAEVVQLPVAVNADSLATWFPAVLGVVAGRSQVALRLHVEDQAYSHDLLRRGEVLAAVTDEPRPVQGCVAEPLGRLRYVPAATPGLVATHRRGNGVDWSALPLVIFNEKDHLQDQVLEAHGAGRPDVVHHVPNVQAFTEAICLGLGWGLVMEPQLAQEQVAGRLVRLPGARPLDVSLFWQRWRLESPALETLSEDVRRAASVLRRARS